MESHEELTRLLKNLNAGVKGAEDKLMDLIHGELHPLARGYKRHERAGHTLQTPALVNEAFLRLGSVEKSNGEDRAHFLSNAAQAMRRILIDDARQKGAAKGKPSGQRESVEKAAQCEEQP